ncbi:MAG: type I glyceraldehyde-3-phosphate dehydrogenase [Promethearchaeota archaeon]
MAKRIAINGFGRIGRLFFKMAYEDPDIEIVAINDIADLKQSAHLLKYDSTYGRWPHDVKVEDDPKSLIIDGNKIPFFAIRDPAQLPWKDFDVDVTYESTGVFRKKEGFSKHLEAGAKKVFVSAPAPETDLTVVYGVNSDKITPDMKSISGASCTTNCLAPIVKVLHDNWKIKRGLMTTVHAYTNDQRILDFGHKDLRRARAAAVNIIPTTTGAAKAIGLVIPDLKGKLDGIAMRVPVKDGSVVDLKCELEKETTADEINKAMKKASENELKDVLGYTEEEIVSSDIIGITYGSLFDAGFTKVIDGTFVSVMSWYDNENSFTIQSLRTIKLL